MAQINSLIQSLFKIFLNPKAHMQSLNTMTIRELPKTKKTAVDEMHPMLKIQKNVIKLRFRDLLLMNSKG